MARNGRGLPGAAEIDRVLRFWLDEVGPAGWYAVDGAVDRRCAGEFGHLMAEAQAGGCIRWEATPGCAGEFGHLMAEAQAGGCIRWEATPRGALAVLILLDQMPRNAFRGTPAAFSGDRRARAVAKTAIAQGHDLQVPEPERQFFYLPLMHSESPADQARCVRLVMMRLPESGADNIEHGLKHREVIRRFGRFPSRNSALGRADTEAERAYRAEGGYMA